MKIPENQQYHDTNQLLTSLRTEIPDIQTFKGKWSVLKTKLNNLQTQITDLSSFPNFTTNSLCSELLFSITQTLTDTLSLAKSCKDPNFTYGKLRTQSDIDSIVAKLDQHVKDSDLLIKSGVLLETGVGDNLSKREAVRVEARNLITRLQIGNFESKNGAMDSLLNLLQEDDKNVLIAVAQGAVAVLVRLLDSSCLEIKEKAVFAISRVSMVDSSKHVLIAEGILLLNHLLRVLESGSTHSSQAVAVGVLRNLALFHEIKINFIEENAVPVLITVLSSGTNLAQENSIGCLCNLVSKDEHMKILVCKEGVIECLKNYWDGATSSRSLEVAVGLLLNLASCRPIAEVIVSKGFIPRVVALLSCEVSGVRVAAVRAVYELTFSTKQRKEVGEAGCVPTLVKMLDVKAAEEKDAAAKALSSIMQYAGNRRIFRKEDRGMIATVQLLDPSVLNLEKKYPILVLLSIAQSKKCRRQMVAAGAGAYLHKLVEMDIEGAKKLLESLGRNKLWGVFARA
ncbi:hypothetical protein IFM89_033942 [Coptis chinensis]|uniref:DUF7032 domain-containing protein n=1 Tax=Coptis chinensis TaxID=261450 RepID=A0A835HYU9_9MAGN|nr:hypothetical protein IFM89_033942 [Coptis chinensis]